jgi:CspA family cold shock protein
MAPSEERGPVDGIVRNFDSEEGWGCIDSNETPGGCFVHFSQIQGTGYRNLAEGEQVRFTYEALDFLQDGYPFRAVQVWPAQSA